MYKENGSVDMGYETPESKEYIAEEIEQEDSGSVRKQALMLFADDILKNSGSILISPVAHKKNVYFAANDCYFYALNADNGSLVWKFKCNSLVSSHPIVADDVLYFNTHERYFYALTAEGRLLWMFDRSSISGSTPAFCNNTIYIGTGWKGKKNENYLYALNAKTGDLLWKAVMNGAMSSPAIVNDMLIAGSGDNYLYAFSAKDGGILWKFMTSDGIDCSPCIANNKGEEVSSIKNRPEKMLHVENGMIYFGSWDNNIYALTLDGKELWRYRMNGPVMHSGPTVCKGTVYIGNLDSHLYALDAFTGQLKWKFKTNMPVVACPVIYKDTVYVGSVDNNLYAISLDGQLRWKFETNGFLTSGVAISDDVIYFTSWDGCIRALSLEGELLWTFKTASLEPSDMDVTPTVNQLVIMNRRILRLWRPETIKKSPFKESLIFRDHVTMGNDYNALKSYTSEPRYSGETPYNPRKKASWF